MSGLFQPGSTQTAVFIAIAVLLPVVCVLGGLVFLRGAQVAQKKPIAMLILGVLCFIGYGFVGFVAKGESNNLLKSAAYWALAIAWLITGVLQYRSRKGKPIEAK